MNATQLLTIIHQGNALEKDDFRALIKLHETFPYFLVPKILAAKYERNVSKGGSKELLHWAAVQSPDRAWLKQLIEEDIHFLFPTPPASPTEDIAPSASTEPPQKGEEKKEEEVKAPKGGTPENPSPTMSRGDVLKQLEENLSKLKTQEKKTQETASPDTEPKEQPAKKAKKRSAHGEDLLETIKKKKKKAIQDDRKKEQIDIIKSFSKRDIKLATIKENEASAKQQDLSEGSTKLKDNLLSESYARLLTKQGKKGKAIEIYEKLILKFPKKKAYFADLINELKDQK